MEIGKQEQLLLGLQGSFLLSKPQKLLLAGSGPPAMVPLPHAVVARVARQLWPEAEPRWLSEDQGAKLSSSPSRASPLAHSRGSVLPTLHRAGFAAGGGHGAGGAVANRTILTLGTAGCPCPGWLSQQTEGPGSRAPHPPCSPRSPPSQPHCAPAEPRTFPSPREPGTGPGRRGSTGRTSVPPPRALPLDVEQ